MAKLTPEQLAQAVRDEEMEFVDALLTHIVCNLGIAIEDPALYFALTLAIGWANMNGEDDQLVDLPSGPATVAQIIERFQLRAFLES